MQRYEKNLTLPSGCRFFLYFCSVKADTIIQQTVEVLRRGGTILYPTDTIWGIGCDARNAGAVERIYAIKERDHSKSMLVLCPGELAGGLGVVADRGGRPTTYILPEDVWRPCVGSLVADNLPASDGTLGIRVPDHGFCREVMRLLGAPLVSTSANLSGHPSPSTYGAIEEELKRRVDYCVPALPEFLSAESRGSRIVKVAADGTQSVIRP